MQKHGRYFATATLMTSDAFFAQTKEWQIRVRQWHRMMLVEKEADDLPADVSQALDEYYTVAGLYRSARRVFYERHYGNTLALASAFLFEKNSAPNLLDLGCGLGSQSLFFAMHGACVTAVDCNNGALSVLMSRKERLEKILGRKLAITPVCADVVKDELVVPDRYDSVHSMFAWNMMQPSAHVLDKVLSLCTEEVRVAILDGNNRCWRSRIFKRYRREVWSPEEMRHEFEQRALRVFYHAGGVALAPFFWKMGGQCLCRAVDCLLCGNWLCPVSHQILARRCVDSTDRDTAGQ